jgi:hypothetical protein
LVVLLLLADALCEKCMVVSLGMAVGPMGLMRMYFYLLEAIYSLS